MHLHLLRLLMEFFPLSAGSSSKNSSGVKESDLLRRVGECCDEEDGTVDCTLSLGLSSSAVHAEDVVGCTKLADAGPVPALVRTCSMCGKTETPLWRNGPSGAKSLCNACGIRFRKEEKRASLMLQRKPNPSSHTKTQSKACADKDADQLALQLDACNYYKRA